MIMFYSSYLSASARGLRRGASRDSRRCYVRYGRHHGLRHTHRCDERARDECRVAPVLVTTYRIRIQLFFRVRNHIGRCGAVGAKKCGNPEQ